MVLACSAEFANAGTLRSLEKTYGFNAALGSADRARRRGNLRDHRRRGGATNGTNTAMVYGTDGDIVAADLQMLEDDKHDQPIYAPVPMVREAVLKRNPQIAEHREAADGELRPRDPAAAQCAGADRWRVDQAVAEDYLKSQAACCSAHDEACRSCR